MTGKRLSDDLTRPPASPVWAPQFGPLPRLPDDAVELEADEERGVAEARGDAAADLLPE